MRNHFILVFLLALVACSKGPVLSPEKLIFKKPAENPVLRPDSSYLFFCPVKQDTIRWQKADVFNPTAIVKDNKIYVLFRAEDNPSATYGGRTSRIGLAWSEDGIHFTKHPVPVLYPAEEEFLKWDYPGGCEDPRIVQAEDGMYVLTYTSWNQKLARLSVAFSTDLIHWEKKGPAFLKAYDGRFMENWTKSGSIVTKMVNDRPVVVKINRKYWMYWGEAFVNLAWSDNLYDWYPLLDEKGEMKKLIRPRPGKFDSGLTECGPAAIMTKEGIALFYNAKNAQDGSGDPSLPQGTYSVGMVIFDKDDMEKVVFRSDNCLLKPELPHELTGQYKWGTVFTEGIVYFQSKWFMYYGTADSFVGVAIAE